MRLQHMKYSSYAYCSWLKRCPILHVSKNTCCCLNLYTKLNIFLESEEILRKQIWRPMKEYFHTELTAADAHPELTPASSNTAAHQTELVDVHLLK